MSYSSPHLERLNRQSLAYSKTLAAATVAMFALTGCIPDSESSSSTSGSTPSGSSSAGVNCNYTDMVSSSERSQSNACGIQVSGAYGAADAKLQEIIQVCQMGNKSVADAEYANAYTKLVNYARDNSKVLSCGSASGTALPNTSKQIYHNFCAKTTGNQRQGLCYGPVFQNEGGCGSGNSSYTYMSQYSSTSACITARDNWSNGR